MRRLFARCWCRRRCGYWVNGTGGRRTGCGALSRRGVRVRLTRLHGGGGAARAVRRTGWRGLLVVAVLGAACARPIAPLPAAPPPSPTPPPPISLPRDAGAHDGLTEWWYVTGHLQSDQDGR